MFDAQKASDAQDKYCDSINAPHFAPNRNVGFKCYRCNQNIFAEKGHPAAAHLPRGKVRLDYTIDKPGYTVEYASEHLITGCPYCCASYCD